MTHAAHRRIQHLTSLAAKNKQSAKIGGFTMGLFNLSAGHGKPERRHFTNVLRSLRRSAITAHRYLYEQHDFLQLLYLERHRSERSSRPLCLILLEGSTVTETVTRRAAFQQLFQLLRSTVRETDIIGWYEHDCTLGFIFSDLNSSDHVVIKTLRDKIAKTVDILQPQKLIKQIRISVHVFPKGNGSGGATDSIFYPDLPHHSQAHRAALVLKRFIDVGVSVLLLCLFGPLLLIIASLIRLTSRGPVIFTQLRIGQGGKPFRFCKFRSMYADNDAAIHKAYVTKFISHGRAAAQTKQIYKITNDPRVTPFGRLLRKTSLDELPQLWNVLCGHMSLVGPRPPLPYELECYAPWHHRRILEVKPGITGLWQVTGRSRTTFNEMVRLDLKYVQQWSIWLDLKILLQTPKAVLMGEGAY